MAIIGGPSLGAATSAAPGDDMDANAVVHAARFRKERTMASGATRAAERKKRRALHHMATAVGPTPNQVLMPIPAVTSPPSLLVKTSTNVAPSRTTAPNLAIILVPVTTSAPRKASASSPTKVPILPVVPILTIMDTPSLNTTSSLATGPSSAAALAARSTLSSGGKPIVVRATTFKKDRSRAGAATRAAECKKKKAMLQTSVVSIQAVAPGPTAKVIPATTSKRNPVVAPSMPIAFSRVDEMSPPNTPSFDLVLTLAATDQPKTTNGSTAQRNKVSKSTENLNLELTLGTLG
ncbi:hypothetical protein OsJ_35911 [Oryza sativa Japonica Group]|uniref:Uncharacterized protein n=2 Tax=Oryza sativa subsp. japonica TaxID=39947 RepID=A0A8J8Y7L9_ORYSJ|nr:hypothetical protein LOC_Os12g23750 [Oryza sativa Japonica Group]EAZ20302.1 hypothetical protein OsJ_35911 [Oryza sativa Japonica Group]